MQLVKQKLGEEREGWFLTSLVDRVFDHYAHLFLHDPFSDTFHQFKGKNIPGICNVVTSQKINLCSSRFTLEIAPGLTDIYFMMPFKNLCLVNNWDDMHEHIGKDVGIDLVRRIVAILSPSALEKLDSFKPSEEFHPYRVDPHKITRSGAARSAQLSFL